MLDNKNLKNNITEAEYQSVGGFLLEIMKVFALALIIFVPIKMFLFQPFFVQGASMEPNFREGEYLIVNELGYKKTKVGLGDFDLFTVKNFKDLERGDVVVFRYPKNPNLFFIKRVVAVSGEKVEIKNGRIRIYNDENPEGYFLDESEYLSKKIRTNGDVLMEINEGEVFVLGDNRGASSDSRAWGTVGEDDIIGRVVLRAWPFDKF